MRELLTPVVLLACLMLSVPVLAAQEVSREGSGWGAVGDVGPAVGRDELTTREPDLGPELEPNG